jgi:hypothetical protein
MMDGWFLAYGFATPTETKDVICLTDFSVEPQRKNVCAATARLITDQI